MKKKIIKIITISIIIILLIAIDLGLFRHYGPHNYSVIRHLYCITINQEEYAHISPYSNYASSGDYMHIYQCGDEWDAGTTKEPSKDFGISIDYPQEWEYNEYNQDIRKPINGVKWFDINNRTPEPGRAPYLREGELLIEAYYYKTELEVEEWFAKYDTFSGEHTEMTKDGYKFMISNDEILAPEEGGSIKTKRYYFKKEGNIFVIQAITLLNEQAQGLIDTFDDMIEQKMSF